MNNPFPRNICQKTQCSFLRIFFRDNFSSTQSYTCNLWCGRLGEMLLIISYHYIDDGFVINILMDIIEMVCRCIGNQSDASSPSETSYYQLSVQCNNTPLLKSFEYFSLENHTLSLSKTNDSIRRKISHKKCQRKIVIEKSEEYPNFLSIVVVSYLYE